MASISAVSNVVMDLEKKAEAALDEDNPEEALKLANQIIELVDDSPVHFDLRGRALFGLCRVKEAFADFTRAVDLEPETLSYHVSAAQCLIFDGDSGGALKILEIAFRICGEQKDWEALSTKAEAHLGCGQYRRAVEDATASLELEEDAYTLYIRSWALASLYQIHEAKSDIKMARDLDPECQAYIDAEESILALEEKERQKIVH